MDTQNLRILKAISMNQVQDIRDFSMIRFSFLLRRIWIHSDLNISKVGVISYRLHLQEDHMFQVQDIFSLLHFMQMLDW